MLNQACEALQYLTVQNSANIVKPIPRGSLGVTVTVAGLTMYTDLLLERLTDLIEMEGRMPL